MANSLHNLAGPHIEQGRYEEACPLYERALAIREEALGPEHPKTIVTRDALDAFGQSDG